MGFLDKVTSKTDSKVPPSSSEDDEKHVTSKDVEQAKDHHLGSRGEKALDYYDQHETFTPEEERKVLWKIDLHLMPILAITYGLQFLDKVTLSYAANYGLIQDTNLKGSEYSLLGAAFYISFLVFEFPLVALMQKFTIHRYLGINLFLWGGILMCHAACHNFAGLMISRLLLGLFESTISPGSNIITGRFYTKKEIPFRTSIWVSFNGMGQFVGGLISFGIGHIGGSLPSWKYIFLILGAITSLWGFIVFFFLQSSPVDARFLTERERKIAVSRVAANKSGVSAENKIQRHQIIDAFTDPQVWIIFFLSVAMMAPNGGLTNFTSLIIQGFNFDPLNTMIHQLPVGGVQFFIMLIGGILLSYVPSGRIYISIAFMIPCLICSALLWQLPRTNLTGLLISVYFVSSPYVVTMIAIFAFMNVNVSGSTKKSTVNAVYFVGYCVGNIAGPFFFKTEQQPTYTDGSIMMLTCFSLCIALLAGLRFYYMYENKRKTLWIESQGLDPAAQKVEAEKLGFLDKTDRENPYFLYSL